MRGLSGASSDGGDEGGSEGEVYLREHDHHLQVVLRRAVQLLQETEESEGRAGVLHDLLQELYHHENRLQRLREEGLVGDALGRQPSLVPISVFLKLYLTEHIPSLSDSCRALQPFTSRASFCPIFSYVVERLGLLQEPSPEATQDALAIHLRYIHAIFQGPPQVPSGPLGVHHTHLSQRYADCLSRRRYRIRLQEGESGRLASQVLLWLEDTYTAALKDLREEKMALWVLERAQEALLTMPHKHPEYLLTVVTAAMKLLTTALTPPTPPKTHTPTPPPHPPEPLMKGVERFFPYQFLKACGDRLLAYEDLPNVLIETYLQMVSGLVRVFGEPPDQLLPRSHIEQLVALLTDQEDCVLLECLYVVLSYLKEELVPEGVRAVCITLQKEALKGVKEVWGIHLPLEDLHEEQPLLKVTEQVHRIFLLTELPTSPFPDEEVQEAWEEVHASFITYVRRVTAGRCRDPHTRRFILLKNLLRVGSFNEVQKHLDM